MALPVIPDIFFAVVPTANPNRIAQVSWVLISTPQLPHDLSFHQEMIVFKTNLIAFATQTIRPDAS
ncbi:MAG: hypothetical protein QNL54_01290 [Rhodobacterales bacterium]|jgi:hypothetical protein